MEDPMKLTDTQLVLLSAASQREDRAIELPTNLKGGAAQKVTGRLLSEGLVEAIRARASLPVWRIDGFLLARSHSGEETRCARAHFSSFSGGAHTNYVRG